MGLKNQIIITTHCPLFVDRVHVKSNVIVTKNKAVSAKSISEIRDVLGVRASDNLQNAELVILVEGEEDRTALQPLLSCASNLISGAFKHGTIAIDTLNGGTNMSYKLAQLRDSICNVLVLLDNDECGRKSFEKAELDLLITAADVTFVVCPGMKDSEFEDLIDPATYASAIKAGFGVNITAPKFKSNKKWSERMRDVFRQHGKQWSDREEARAKRVVADLVQANPLNALLPAKRESFDAFAKAVEERLKELAQSR